MIDRADQKTQRIRAIAFAKEHYSYYLSRPPWDRLLIDSMVKIYTNPAATPEGRRLALDTIVEVMFRERSPTEPKEGDR